MSTGPAAVSFLVDAPVGWSADWAWGLPLIVLTIQILVFGTRSHFLVVNDLPHNLGPT